MRIKRTVYAVRFCVVSKKQTFIPLFCACIQNFENRLDFSENLWYNIKAVKDSSKKVRGVAQFGRVLGLGPRCRRFESCRLDQITTENQPKKFFEKISKKGLTNQKRCGIINKSVKLV